MRKLTVYFIVLCALCGPLSAAQELNRIVILPFDGNGANQAFELGLATALQRSLNVLDTVYVPPTGDTFLYTRKLIEDENVSVAAIAEAFGADTVISGQINALDAQADITLRIGGPAYGEVQSVDLRLPASTPAELSKGLADAVLSTLELGVSGPDRQELDAVTAQVPSVPSLNAVSQGALRLPTSTLTQLSSAATLDPDSSWVQAEYARALALAGETEAALAASLRATELAPSDVEAWVVRGVVLQASGDSAGALAAYDAALAIHPSHPYALLGKGTLDADPALIEQAIAVYPRLTDAYVALAQLQSNPQQALQTLRRGAAAVPEAVSLHRSLMSSALSLNDAAGALSYLRNEVLGAQENPAPALYSLAAMLPDAQTAEALAIVQEGLARYPSNPTLARAEADLLERSGDLAAAEASLSAVLAANPTSVDVANDLALLQAKRGDVDAARETLLSVAGDTQNVTVQFNLAQLYLQSGQAEAALSTLEPLLQTQENDAELQSLYGVALARLGRNQEALTALDAALSLEPTLESALRAKALLSQEQALTGGAVTELNAEAASAFNEGKSALEAGNYSDAASAFERARNAQDEGIIAFYQGYSLYFLGQTRAAAQAYERAAEVYPESDIVLNNLGLAQIELGRYDLALANLEQAVSINDENANAHLNLGLVNFELARYGRAVTEWERALALDSSLVTAIADRLDEARERAGQ